MSYCEKCKKIMVKEEVVLTQAEVEAGVTPESKRALSDSKINGSKNEVVKTQAEVEAEAASKRKPIGEEPEVTEEPKNNLEKVKAIIARKKKAKKKK